LRCVHDTRGAAVGVGAGGAVADVHSHNPYALEHAV
jgi:hypothetical protein